MHGHKRRTRVSLKEEKSVLCSIVLRGSSPTQGYEPKSFALQANSLPSELQGKPEGTEEGRQSAGHSLCYVFCGKSKAEIGKH